MLQQFGRTHRSNQLQARHHQTRTTRLPCISPASRLHLACISPAPPLHLACISPASPLHLARISPRLQAPHYQILTTDVGGEQRFASSVVSSK